MNEPEHSPEPQLGDPKKQAPFKLALMVGLTWFIWPMLTKKIQSSFLHNINLPIHEFGHLLFTPFGEFMHFLGGSLFQVIFPLIFVGVFLFRKDIFAAGVVLIWVGDSLIDVSTYSADATDQLLPLIGGEHDWAYLLGELDLMHRDKAIGGFVFLMGAFSIVLGLVLGYYQAFKQGKWIEINPSK